MRPGSRSADPATAARHPADPGSRSRSGHIRPGILRDFAGVVVDAGGRRVAPEGLQAVEGAGLPVEDVNHDVHEVRDQLGIES